MPRDVFAAHHGRAANAKVSPGWLERTAPAPKSETSTDGSAPPAPPTDLQAHRRLVSASRRKALASGVQSLWERREAIRRRNRATAAFRRQHNREAALAEPSPVSAEILTQPSVPAALLDPKTASRVTPDPDRFVRAALRKARTDAKLANERERRKDALIRLYTLSRGWIVDQDELEARVEALFGASATPFGTFGGAAGGGYAYSNAWEAWGRPPTLEEMAAEGESARTGSADGDEDAAVAGLAIGRTRGLLPGLSREDAERAARRQREVMEGLTGGKMPTD